MTFNFAQKNRNMRILKFIVTFILLMGSVSNSLAQVSSGRLKDKVAIVTGAASGNGKAIAVLFANEGAKVILADINGIEVRKIADTLQQNQSDVIPVEVDVTREDDVQRMINSALGRFGRIDILVNNAGLMKRVPMIEMSHTDFLRVIDVHVGGAFNCSKAVLPDMIAKREGKISRVCFSTQQSGRLLLRRRGRQRAGRRL